MFCLSLKEPQAIIKEYPPPPFSLYTNIGPITSSSITLTTPNDFSSLSAPQFPLRGLSVGGEPTDITWRRDGVELISTGPYTITALRVLTNLEPCSTREYQSILTVEGRLPGVYTYTVNNGDTATAVVGTFTVEGTKHIYQGSVCHACYTNPFVPIHCMSSLDHTFGCSLNGHIKTNLLNAD